MTDQALFAAILADPEDDAPRLVYADWLDEHGDSDRAEFIRVQCDLARRPKYDDRRPALEARERELLKRYGAAWAKPVAAITKEYEFRRGFVAAVTIGAAKLLSHGDQLFATAPVRHVRVLRLGSANASAADLAASPLWPRVRSLTLGGRLAPGDLRTVLMAPGLKKLTGLSVAGGFAVVDLAPLLEGRLPHLERLDLDAEGPVVTTAHVEQLAAANWAANLKHLNLNWHKINVGGVQAIAESKRLKGLTRLHLRLTGVGLGGVKALSESKTLANLTTLDLRSNRLNDNAVRPLTESKLLPSLTELYLGMNDLGPDGARAVAEWRGLARLRLLHLYQNRIGDDGAIALAESPYAANLRYLDVTETGLTARGREALAASPYLKGANLAGLREWPEDPAW
jgi:uncharacterized protein (TIGR02996 family)